MSDFQTRYRQVFETLGFPLSERTALAPAVLDEAGARLGVRVPAALRDYYLVAGREKRFNNACQRLLPPSRWRVDKKRLIFMEENQSVCWWGVSVRNPDADDPPVAEAYDDEDEGLTWHPLLSRCSAFLTLMLYHQAVSGGFKHCAGAFVANLDLSRREMTKRGWTYQGELKGELIFSRPGQVVCASPDEWPEGLGWMVLAGGKTARDLKAIRDEIGIERD